MFRHTMRCTIAAAILAASGLTGCGPSLREGPNVFGVPEGFLYDANLTSGRRVLPGRTQVSQSGWMTLREPHCSIVFTEYAGAVAEAEVEAARSEYARRYTHESYGPLEGLTVDRRPAWGWPERQNYRGKLSSLEYTAVVAYDNPTWTIEFYAADPTHCDPEFLKELVTGFRLGPRG